MSMATIIALSAAPLPFELVGESRVERQSDVGSVPVPNPFWGRLAFWPNHLLEGILGLARLEAVLGGRTGCRLVGENGLMFQRTVPPPIG